MDAAETARPWQGLRSLLPRTRSAGQAAALWGAGLVLVACGLAIAAGPLATAQATIYGLVAGSYLALGAVGLTLLYGVLRLVNFAHGDMMTFGAYAALGLGAAGLPFAAAVVLAMALTASLGVVFEAVLWRPVRRRGATAFQLLLMTIGLAFLIRNGIQFVAGSGLRSFDIDIISTVGFGGLRIGRMQLVVVAVGLAVLTAVGLMLRHTRLGRQMRALADNFDLAEVSGIDTQRIVIATWLLAGALAGLAGVLYGASIGVMNPNLGFSLILGLFAATVLGGIGNAYGALVGGLIIGLAQEWSTLLLSTRWKLAVGFAILVVTLILRPQGIFGRRRTV